MFCFFGLAARAQSAPASGYRCIDVAPAVAELDDFLFEADGDGFFDGQAVFGGSRCRCRG
jgi:hypothetical protein